MRFGRVEVTGSFLLLAALANFLDRQGLIPLALTACLFHEVGHYVTIRGIGEDIKAIRLTAIGAEMVLARPLGYWQEGLVALAGPAVNLLLALFGCAVPGGAPFAGLNLVLAGVNFIPVGRLDGGRALHCTLALLWGKNLAERVGWILDRVCVTGLLVLGSALVRQGGTITLLLVATWMMVNISCLDRRISN